MRRIISYWFCAMIVLALLPQLARAQSAPRHYLSAASNNSTLVLGRPSVLKMLQATNTTATIYYVKVYDKATAPTCGTDVPVLTLPVPASVTGGYPTMFAIGDGLLFSLGVGFCIVAGIADNDNTSAAAGVVLNVGVTGR